MPTARQPVEHICDDDIYIYDPLTLRLVRQIGSGEADAAAYRGVFARGPVPAGFAWGRGMQVAHLGLWRDELGAAIQRTARDVGAFCTHAGHARAALAPAHCEAAQ